MVYDKTNLHPRGEHEVRYQYYHRAHSKYSGLGLSGYNEQEKRVLGHPEILATLFGLYIQGRSRYEEINLFRHDGYAPIFSYIGAEGYMLNCRLREGKQHCQKDTPEYLCRNIRTLKKLNTQAP